MSVQKIKLNFKRYVGDGLLIVFSVLFALLINKTYEDWQTNKYKSNAINQIKTELLGNQKILNGWMKNHYAIYENIDTLIENRNDNIIAIAESRGYIPLEVFAPEGKLIGQLLSHSAWSSAQSTGILSEFDFAKLQSISKTYELQQFIMHSSIDKIAENILTKSSDIKNMQNLLVMLRLRFENLLSQEYQLDQLYKETIATLE